MEHSHNSWGARKEAGSLTPAVHLRLFVLRSHIQTCTPPFLLLLFVLLLKYSCFWGRSRHLALRCSRLLILAKPFLPSFFSCFLPFQNARRSVLLTLSRPDNPAMPVHAIQPFLPRIYYFNIHACAVVDKSTRTYKPHSAQNL